MESDANSGGPGQFPTTQWDLVVRLQEGSPEEIQAAMESLCQAYWPPIYAFLRRRGLSEADAKDMTQSFFHRVITKGLFADADREKGRMRSFLLSALKNHLADSFRQQNARKRGGGAFTLSIDHQEGESYYQALPPDDRSPDWIYERAWAENLLRRVLELTRERYHRIGKGDLFESMKSHLTWEEPELPYQEMAARLDMPASQLRLQVHRMRRRFRSILESEIARTVRTREEAEQEIRFLMQVLENR